MNSNLAAARITCMIREANREDYPQLLDIQLTCIRGLADTYSENEILAWTNYLDREGANRYGQYENRMFIGEKDQAIGFVSWLQDTQKPEANLECLYVLAQFRNRGIGALLLQEAEASLPGGTIITVRSALNAEPFYARHGYRNMGHTVSRAGFRVSLLEKTVQT